MLPALTLLTLLAVTPPAAVPDWPLRAWIVTYGSLAMADASETMFGMGCCRESLREANPALRWTEERPVLHGVSKSLLHTGVIFGVMELRRSRPRLGLWVMVGLTAFQTWVVVENYHSLEQAREARR